MYLLIISALLCVLFYYKVVKPLSYWKDQGVPHKKPIPILGNFAAIFFQRISFFDQIQDWYKQFPNKRYFGIHQFTKPNLFLKDLELIKNVTIKDFEHFVDHNTLLPADAEPLLGQSLFNLTGQRWRDIRATLSPSFTSSKMKTMFNLISECADEFTEYFEKQNKKLLEVEMKDIFTRFTNDVIATVAFGLKCNSLEDKNNEFYLMGKKITSLGPIALLTVNLYLLLPNFAKYTGLKILPKSATDFFTAVIKETLRKRENEGLFRPDMIQLLVDARKKQMNSNVGSGVITDTDITAQALIFMFGGFETSSTLMSFLAYELAMHEDVQEQLQIEIDETLNSCNGSLTYEALHKMKYMDMVVSETLRMWPPAALVDRMCVKDYVIEPTSSLEKPVIIRKGDLLQIPIIGLHRDPNYFSNPDEFDPERFSDDNKNLIPPFSYLPFGSGPRTCIASRFALMENKALMFHLLSKFNIVKTDKTPSPIKMRTNTFNVVPKGGFWLGLKLRKTE